MSNRIFVTPVAGKSTRSPLPPYAPLPAEGSWQIDGAEWRRLEQFGDVTISATGPARAKVAPAAKTAKS